MRNSQLPKIYVVLPVHNRLAFTKTCLSSFEKQTYKNFIVVIVDDGSTDGTTEHIKKKYPNWKIIKGNGKWWWTKSVYKGVEYALKNSKKGDFVLTMNNDCVFDKNYIKKIVEDSMNNKRSIVGSLILDVDNPKKVVDAGVRINWEKAITYGVASAISSEVGFYTKRKTIKDIDTLPGKGTLIPVEIFEKTGNFNYKRLPHYIADYEFFCRAKFHGANLIVSTNAKVYNHVRETGIIRSKNEKLNFRKKFEAFFSRKSKSNLLDHLNFILLACPNKYKLKNILVETGKIFPLYSYIKLAIHNTPIYFVQTIERVRRKNK